MSTAGNHPAPTPVRATQSPPCIRRGFRVGVMRLLGGACPRFGTSAWRCARSCSPRPSGSYWRPPGTSRRGPSCVMPCLPMPSRRSGPGRWRRRGCGTTWPLGTQRSTGGCTWSLWRRCRADRRAAKPLSIAALQGRVGPRCGCPKRRRPPIPEGPGAARAVRAGPYACCDRAVRRSTATVRRFTTALWLSLRPVRTGLTLTTGVGA